MRKQQVRLVITFHTTSDAMATEKLCKKEALPGKLISVPRRLTSDCGIAWSADPCLLQQLEQLLLNAGIDAAGYHELSL